VEHRPLGASGIEVSALALWPAQSAAEELDESLRRMGFDYLDVVYLFSNPAGRDELPLVPATWPDWRLARGVANADPSFVDEPVIERAEVVGLLFNVSDIASSLARIERLLEEDGGEEEADGS
jgi:hypothetical protein